MTKQKNSSLFLLIVGLLAALFFSVTFLINRAISLDGGHWFWSGTLRYFYTLLFLALILILFKGFNYFKSVLAEFFNNYKFWLLCGTIGFGFFYALICFAADYSPAWVVATTWQITILASLFVLSFFGQKISKVIWLCTFFVVIGITMVNMSHFEMSNIEPLIYGAIPVLIAAFCYPFGNQLVWEAKNGRKNLPKINPEVINNAFSKVFLLTLGSTPLWIVLFFFVDAKLPSSGQITNVAVISLFSGVIATSLFLYARSKANTGTKLVIVDATQSGEVFFALGGEILFLQAVFPSGLGVVGIFVTLFGLLALVKFDKI